MTTGTQEPITCPAWCVREHGDEPLDEQLHYASSTISGRLNRESDESRFKLAINQYAQNARPELDVTHLDSPVDMMVFDSEGARAFAAELIRLADEMDHMQ